MRTIKVTKYYPPRPTTYIKSLCVIMLVCVLIAFGACRKTPVHSYSKFRVQHLDYTGIAYVNSVKLSNGNFVTVDQDTSLLSINIAEYDTKSNLKFLKKYPCNVARDITCCIPFGTGFLITGYINDNTAFFATMFDVNGNALWDSSYSPAGNNNIHTVTSCTAMDGNILVVGSHKYHGGNQHPGVPFVVKINPQSGSLINAPKTLTGMDSTFDYWVTSVHERTEGIFMSGFYFFWANDGWNQGSLLCLKAGEDGIVHWHYTAPIPPANTSVTGYPYENAYNIAETNTGPIVLTGISAAQFSSASVYYFNNYWYPMIGSTFVYSFDPATGNKTDSVAFGANSKTTYPIINPTNDGGFIEVTTANNFLNSFTVPTSVLLIKTDEHFNIQWQKNYYPDGNNYMALGVFPLADGYEVIGQSNGILSDKATVGTFLMKADLQGNLKD